MQRSKPKVFISYNHQDLEIALKLEQILSSEGIETILDQSMKAGDSITDFVRGSISSADLTLLIVSDASLLSGWVGIETDHSFSKSELTNKKSLIACYLESNFFDDEFVSIAGSKIDNEIKKINSLIKERLDKNMDTNDLNPKLSRLYNLRANLPNTISHLRETLCIDISGDKLLEKKDKIIESILNIPKDDVERIYSDVLIKSEFQEKEDQNVTPPTFRLILKKLGQWIISALFIGISGYVVFTNVTAKSWNPITIRHFNSADSQFNLNRSYPEGDYKRIVSDGLYRWEITRFKSGSNQQKIVEVDVLLHPYFKVSSDVEFIELRDIRVQDSDQREGWAGIYVSDNKDNYLAFLVNAKGLTQIILSEINDDLRSVQNSSILSSSQTPQLPLEDPTKKFQMSIAIFKKNIQFFINDRRIIKLPICLENQNKLMDCVPATVAKEAESLGLLTWVADSNYFKVDFDEFTLAHLKQN